MYLRPGCSIVFLSDELKKKFSACIVNTPVRKRCLRVVRFPDPPVAAFNTGSTTRDKDAVRVRRTSACRSLNATRF